MRPQTVFTLAAWLCAGTATPLFAATLADDEFDWYDARELQFEGQAKWGETEMPYDRLPADAKGKDAMTADDWQQIFKAAKDTYIFAYFGNERDGMKLAASEDGLQWRELNGGRPVLVPEVGKEKLIRDPSVVQGPDGTFHAVWTTSWRSPEIGYASSKDLIHWSEQRVIPVMADFPSAKNAWAPEITFDDESGEFYIYWASTLEEDVGKFKFGNGDWLHRIYLTTTKDFETFTPTRLWFEPPFTVIDAAIVKTGCKWMMVVKNEDSKPLKEKNLRVTFTDSLANGFPVEVSAPINFCRESVEGPAPLVVGDEIFVYYDMYRDRRYGMVSSSDGGKNWRDRSKEISLPKGIRHGTAFKVSGLLSTLSAGSVHAGQRKGFENPPPMNTSKNPHAFGRER